jgi:hypothetical protein
MSNFSDLIKNYKKDGEKEIPPAHPSTSRSALALECAFQSSVSRFPAVFHHMILKHNAVFIHLCLLGAHWGRSQLAGSARKTCSTSKPQSTSSWIKQSPFTQVSRSSYWTITFFPPPVRRMSSGNWCYRYCAHAKRRPIDTTVHLTGVLSACPKDVLCWNFHHSTEYAEGYRHFLSVPTFIYWGSRKEI